MEEMGRHVEGMSVPGNARKKITLLEKTAYGIAGFGGGITRNMISFYLLFFYADVIGLKPGLVSLAVMIGFIWDAVTDPVMGSISDHTHSRFGRRRIYLLTGGIPLGLLVFWLWTPPIRFSGIPLFIYLSIIIVFLYAAFTVVSVPYLALGGELSPDPDERSSVFGFNFAFSKFGELTGAIIPNLVLQFSDDAVNFLPGRSGLLSDEFAATILNYLNQPANAFRVSAGFAGLMITSTTLATFTGTHERVALASESRTVSPTAMLKTLFHDLFATLKNRPFFVLLLSMMTIDIGSGITASLMMFIAKYWLKMEEYIPLFYITYVVFAMGSAVFWVQFSKRTTKKLAYLLGQIILTAALFASFFMQEGKILRVFALLAFSGFGLGAYIMLWSLIADLVDFDEYRTRARREGAYYGIYTLFSKTAGAIGIGLTGLYLQFIGYEKGAEITAGVLLKIKVLYAPLTALINLAGVIVFCFFHYDKKEHEQIQKQLIERKAELLEAQSE